VITVRRMLAVFALAVAVAIVAALPAAAQTTTRCTALAVLQPGNEVPPSGSQASGATLVRINGTRLSFTTIIANPGRESFFAGHIHTGAAGVNGPVLITLFSGSTDRRLFTQFESIEITEQQATTVCGNLAGHYVNYHTTDFPGGAIRGQLTRLF
jgi:CHRD domain